MKTHKSILTEAEDFNDIIIGDFYDTYENLPLKTYLGYQFYHDQCKVSNIILYNLYTRTVCPYEYRVAHVRDIKSEPS